MMKELRRDRRSSLKLRAWGGWNTRLEKISESPETRREYYSRTVNE
jgi:hypothetical protein